MYKIEFDLESPIIFTDRPIFDTILAYCCWKELKKNERILHRQMNPLDEHIELDIPLTRNNYYLGSVMFFEKNTQSEQKYVKKWEGKFDGKSDFKGKIKKIYFSSGYYKSYQLPYLCNSIDKVWFYFETEKLNKVIELIESHLVGIGKKVTSGFGWIKDFKIIEEIRINFDEYVLRPIPYNDKQYKNKYIKKTMRIIPPYYCDGNKELCLYPEETCL